MSLSVSKTSENKIKAIIQTSLTENPSESYVSEIDVNNINTKLRRLVEEATNTKIFYKTTIRPNKLSDWGNNITTEINGNFSKLLKSYTENAVKDNSIIIDRVKFAMKNEDINGRKITERELYDVFDKSQSPLENKILSLDPTFSCKNFTNSFNVYKNKVDKSLFKSKVIKIFIILIPIILTLFYMFFMQEPSNNSPSLLEKLPVKQVQDLVGAIDGVQKFASYVSIFFLVLAYIVYCKIVSLIMKRKLKKSIEQISVAFYQEYIQSETILVDEFNNALIQHSSRIQNEYINFFKKALNIT